MALPSPGRLERLFRPYALPSEAPVRVWGTDLGSTVEGAPPGAVSDAGPPRLLCLAGGRDALVVLRQTRVHHDALDGFVVPWSLVRSLRREAHLVRDVVSFEVAGHAPMRALVSNHLLLPGNRAAARALCGLAPADAGSGVRDDGFPKATTRGTTAEPTTRPIAT